MVLLFILNIGIIVTLFFALRNKVLVMPVTMLAIALIDYPLIGEGNFINAFFIISTLAISFFMYYANKKASLAVKDIKIEIALTIAQAFLIPMLLATSKSSIYLASSYLSVSILIISLIILALGMMDKEHVQKQWSIYRFINHPIKLGFLLLYSYLPVLTLFMPHFYLYLIWYGAMAAYQLKNKAYSY